MPTDGPPPAGPAPTTVPRARRRPGDQSLALVAAFVCGILLAGQSRINGDLGTHVPAMAAAWFSFFIGLLAISLLWVTRRFRQGVAAVRAAVSGGRLPAWQVLGGFAGALVVATQTYAVPRVGVATFLIALIGGQTVNALLVDRLRLGPAAPQLITPARVAAAALAVVGVVIAVTPGLQDGTFLWLPVAIAFLVGMSTAVQQATNARVTAVSGTSTVTAFLNFATGSVLLVLIGAWTVLPAGWPDLTGIPWWTWTGGVLGVFFIILAAWAVMHSGVLLFGLVTITSQMGTGVLLDLVKAETRDQVGVQLLAGIGLTVVAAVWAALARARSRRRARPVHR
ncbi:DMT family transporter [Ornithinimicrobium cavernae]|uniref:DMT family transporter n=1 Tax=Ornithinimicrobium cavernae TaxID=2666047 RepID=UPI000D69A092|nr:DMT family transporter [Ornithinimicrobium cavernae]